MVRAHIKRLGIDCAHFNPYRRGSKSSKRLPYAAILIRRTNGYREQGSRLRRALLEMVRGLGLRFCSADLVLTPDSRHVFLDLNPNGQWLWLELEAGLPLSAAMADLLAGGIPEPPARTG